MRDDELDVARDGEEGGEAASLGCRWEARQASGAIGSQIFNSFHASQIKSHAWN